MSTIAIKLHGPPVLSTADMLRGTIEVHNAAGLARHQSVELSLTQICETWQCKRDILSDPFWIVSVDKTRLATAHCSSWQVDEVRSSSKQEMVDEAIRLYPDANKGSFPLEHGSPATFSFVVKLSSEHSAVRLAKKQSIRRTNQVVKLYLKATLVEDRFKRQSPSLLPPSLSSLCQRIQPPKRLCAQGVRLACPDLCSRDVEKERAAAPPAFTSIDGDRVIEIAPMKL